MASAARLGRGLEEDPPEHRLRQHSGDGTPNSLVSPRPQRRAPPPGQSHPPRPPPGPHATPCPQLQLRPLSPGSTLVANPVSPSSPRGAPVLRLLTGISSCSRHGRKCHRRPATPPKWEEPMPPNGAGGGELEGRATPRRGTLRPPPLPRNPRWRPQQPPPSRDPTAGRPRPHGAEPPPGPASSGNLTNGNAKSATGRARRGTSRSSGGGRGARSQLSC